MGILDLLFPKRCVACSKAGEYLCSNCFSFVSFSVFPRCLICGNPSVDGLTHPVCRTRYSIDGCFSGVSYSGVIKKLLYTFKYKPYLSDLYTFLADLLYESLIQNEIYMQIVATRTPIFVPIPLHAKKFRQRGYNQSLLLAKALARLENGEVYELLTRTRETVPQFGLSREERLANIKGAFAVSGKVKVEQGKTKDIFLIDDVVTTGSTLVEAANILKRNGYERVWAITFAQD